MFKVILDHAKNTPQPKKDENETPKSYPFWMPKNSEKEIVFVSHEAAQYKAHKVKIGNNWESVTCLKSVGQACPICDLANKLQGYYAKEQYAFTILELTPYTDKKGKVHQNTLKLYICGRKVYDSLRRKDMQAAKTGGNLTGMKFNVIRGGDDTSPGCGHEFETLGTLTREEMLALNPNAKDKLDYESLLKPDPDKVAKAVLALEAQLKDVKNTSTVNYN